MEMTAILGIKSIKDHLMEKVVCYFTHHKKSLLLVCLLVGCILIFLNLSFQIVILAAAGAFGAYFCKTFENKILACFVALYAIAKLVMELLHLELPDGNLLVWSGLAILAGTIQGIRKKDRVYLVLVGALILWLTHRVLYDL